MPGPRVVHVRHAAFDVYIGRRTREFPASQWGNPFIIGMAPLDAVGILSAPGLQQHGKHIRFDGPLDRDKVIECYEARLRDLPHLLDALPELRGKVLGCWCAPHPCHGDVLVRLLDEIAVA